MALKAKERSKVYSGNEIHKEASVPVSISHMNLYEKEDFPLRFSSVPSGKKYHYSPASIIREKILEGYYFFSDLLLCTAT